MWLASAMLDDRYSTALGRQGETKRVNRHKGSNQMREDAVSKWDGSTGAVRSDCILFISIQEEMIGNMI